VKLAGRIAVALGLALAAAPPAAASLDAPFGHACVAQAGVRFCPTASDDQRVPSFDGVPLDVDVTLPATGSAPYPTIVMLHGFPGSKASHEAPGPEGRGASSNGWNNVFYSQRGYAVVNYSARGFGRSCGVPDSRTAGCERGWVHFADQRFEVRDAQHLIAALVDDGVADPRAIGVTGESYGGGTALQLAFLEDLVRTVDGRIERWISPGGRRLRIAAAAPRWGWSDFAYAALPNGRFLDFGDPGVDSLSPIGVAKQSVIQILYNGGAAVAFFAPPGADLTADLQMDLPAALAGEPYGSDARRRLRRYRDRASAAGISGDPPPPLLVMNGWTDPIFPVEQAIRAYNRVRRGNQDAPISLQLADVGHFKAGNPLAVYRRFNDDIAAFFDEHLRGGPPGPEPGSVTAFGLGCPKGTAGFGPVRASRWSVVAQGAVRLSRDRSVLVTSGGGDRDTAAAIAPGATSDPCSAVPREGRARGTAVLERRSRGFTLLGLPTIAATIRTRGDDGEIAARLWDVARDGSQRLISQGVYRLRDDQSGRIAFQLFGNGYRFRAGNVVKVEILGRDAPSFRASNERFKLRMERIRVELPTREEPSRSRGIEERRLGR
jgi:pimeloyl-ACP methyl ester carboxylesterase